MKYNVVSNDGEATSVTVFLGAESHVATSDHPNFKKIIDACRQKWGDKTIRDLFDLSAAVGTKFDRLSERVLVKAGRIYFDGVEVHNALTETIARFYVAGLEDFKPLVAFMEKIEINPNAHSRDHLFRWLTKHNFTLCPDGDFLAYKGVQTDSRSVHSGAAIVNNESVDGKVLNAPGTVIEMPRDQVRFDPSQGCSTGLHAGNWRYARSFASRVLRVKINPRDVVSVPVDSNDEKLRVCRYRVLDVVTAEDRSLLYLGNLDKRTQRVEPKKAEERVAPKAEAKKPLVSTTDPRKGAPAKAPAKPKAPVKKAAAPKLPRYYEQYKREHFEAMPYNDLRWLAKEWECKLPSAVVTKAELVKVLVRTAAKRLKTWN